MHEICQHRSFDLVSFFNLSLHISVNILFFLGGRGGRHKAMTPFTGSRAVLSCCCAVPAGVMKFFGQVGHGRPEHVLTRYPGFARCTLAMVCERDPSRQLAALDTVTCLAMSPDGKRALGKLGTECHVPF